MFIVIFYVILLASFRLLEIGDTVTSIKIWSYTFIAFTLLLMISSLIRKNFKKSSAVIIVCIVLSGLYFRFTPLHGYSIDIAESTSNSPTIAEGDVIVSKWFNLRFDRGVMVGLKLEHKDYRKRIHGIPGDTVVMCGLRAFINGYTYNVESNWKGINIDTTVCNSQKNRIYTLAENEYFVIGDNLNDSYDSRTYGPVKEENIFAISKFKVDGKTNQGITLGVEFL